MTGCFYILEPMSVVAEDVQSPICGEMGSLCVEDQSQEPLIFRHPSHADEYLSKLQCAQKFMQYVVAGNDVFATGMTINPKFHEHVSIVKHLKELPDDLETSEEPSEQAEWPPERIKKLRFAIRMLLHTPDEEF